MHVKLTDVAVVLESADPLVVRVLGEVDCANAQSVRKEITRFLGEGNDLTVLAGEIRYMDSSGLRLLVDLHRECCRRGGGLRLVEPAPRLNRVLQITGLAGLLAVDSAWKGLPVPA